MKKIKDELSYFQDQDADWSAYFYQRSQRKTLAIPFLFYSWAADDLDKIGKEIISAGLSCYENMDCTVADYTPNNNKQIIDCIPRDSQLIKRFCDNLFNDLIICDSIESGMRNLGGYVLYAAKESGEYCCLIGLGRPFKAYKNTFRQSTENKLEEIKTEFFYLKPFFDLVITDKNCYLMSIRAQSFIGLSNYHEYSMINVHKQLSETGLISNVPMGYPRRSKSIFTTIEECCGDNFERCVRNIIDEAKNPTGNIEEYSKLIFDEHGKIDCTNPESYLSLIDLLAFHKIETRDAIITAAPLGVTWKNLI